MMQLPERKASITIVMDADGELSVVGLPEGVSIEVLDYQWGESMAEGDRQTNREPSGSYEVGPDDGAFVRYTPYTSYQADGE